MNPHLKDALERLNYRLGAHSLGSRRPPVTEADLAPKTRKAIEGRTEPFDLRVGRDGQLYLRETGHE